jgi:tRNA threonylcarbamoyladenosine biosynthesis protein TsaE
MAKIYFDGNASIGFRNYLCCMEIAYTAQAITDAAKTFLNAIGSRKVVALHGEMGAGKTTFVHAVCDILGVKEAVGSPTFSLINEYTTASGESIYHLDLYRLCDETEALNAGVEECFYSGNLCFVEWPEKAEHLLPDDTVVCSITIQGNNKRLLKIK